MICPECHDTGVIALLTSTQPCSCRTAGIPDRCEVGDAFFQSTSEPISVSLDGVEVGNRCYAYDRVAGTVECYVMDGDHFKLCDGPNGIEGVRETLHGRVDVCWK